MKKIFIGSSSAAKKKADTMRRILLESGADEVICWYDSGVFLPGDNTLDKLTQLTHECHGALFIFDKDDKVTDDSGAKRYITRDNVILEAGLFIGALGKEAVTLCYVPGAHMPSDYLGVTHLPYDAEAPDRMKAVLAPWLDRRVRGDRPPKSRNNVLMLPRERIHQIYSLEEEFLFHTEGFHHIHKVRLMNMAGNLAFSPHCVDMAHDRPGPGLNEIIHYTVSEETTVLEVILLEPNSANLEDSASKMPNPYAGSAKDLIYESWDAIFKNITADAAYQAAYNSGRIRCFGLKIGMPYAIFGIEFEEGYKQYNHVKIDLYSSELGNEDQRRSFVTWQDTDPGNYDFFIRNFDSIRSNRSICAQAVPKQIERWLEDWWAH